MTPPDCVECRRAPAGEVIYHRTGEGIGTSHTHSWCARHLAPALLEVCAEVLSGTITAMTVLPGASAAGCEERARHPGVDVAYNRPGDSPYIARQDRSCRAHAATLIHRRAVEVTAGTCTHLLVVPAASPASEGGPSSGEVTRR